MSLQLSLACAEARPKKTSLPWLEKKKRTRILVNFSFSFSRSALISSPHANVVTRGGREEHGHIQWHSLRIQEQLFRFCFSRVFPSSRRKRRECGHNTYYKKKKKKKKKLTSDQRLVIQCSLQ
jgi:hypothetical protein